MLWRLLKERIENSYLYQLLTMALCSGVFTALVYLASYLLR